MKKKNLKTGADKDPVKTPRPPQDMDPSAKPAPGKEVFGDDGKSKTDKKRPVNDREGTRLSRRQK